MTVLQLHSGDGSICTIIFFLEYIVLLPFSDVVTDLSRKITADIFRYFPQTNISPLLGRA